MRQVLFVCRKVFKIAATIKFAADIIEKNAATFKIAACPLWAAVLWSSEHGDMARLRKNCAGETHAFLNYISVLNFLR